MDLVRALLSCGHKRLAKETSADLHFVSSPIKPPLSAVPLCLLSPCRPNRLHLSVLESMCVPFGPPCPREVSRAEILAWESAAVWSEWARQPRSLGSRQQPSKQEGRIGRDKTLFISSPTGILIRLSNGIAGRAPAWGMSSISMPHVT